MKVLVVLFALVTLTRECSAFSSAFAPIGAPTSLTWTRHDNLRRRRELPGVRRQRVRDTSLPMGIRSFIKRKILRKDGDGPSEEDDAMTLHSLLQSPGSAGLMESPSSDAGDPPIFKQSGLGNKRKTKPPKKAQNKSGDAEKSGAYEDTNRKIHRIKSGGMTEEEKMMFLNNALTRTLPKQKPKGPPIRQAIPGMEDVSSEGSKKTKGRSWDAKTGTKVAPAEISVASLMMDGKMKNEEAKRKYMDSITNPDRFAGFSSMQPRQPSTAPIQAGKEDALSTGDDQGEGIVGEEVAQSVQDSNQADDTDFSQMKRQIAEDRALLNPDKNKQEQSAAREAVESILSMISSNNEKKKTSADTSSSEAATPDTGLASRLEQAAHEQERREAEARVLAEKAKENERQAQAELQKQREQEFQRREEERMEKARKQAEAIRAEEEQKEEKIRAELEARQAAQDAYWAKQLKKENARVDRSKPVEIKEKGKEFARDTLGRIEQNAARGARDNGGVVSGKNEVLKRVAEKDPNESAAQVQVTRTVPQNSTQDISASSFVKEQRARKAEIDRLRKLDEQSLKSLNSPLPAPGRMNRQVGLTPQIPQRIVPPPTPAPRQNTIRPQSPASTPDLSLAALTMAKKKEDGPSTAIPVPPPASRQNTIRPQSPASTPDLSLAALTMAKKKEDGPSTAIPVPPPAPAQPLNLFEMTKLKKDEPPSPVASKRPPAPKQQRKRVVRQQLPLSSREIIGDDDDDDDDLIRSSAPGLTVADALKAQRKRGDESSTGGAKKDLSADDKAKQWGIDMSKFS